MTDIEARATEIVIEAIRAWAYENNSPVLYVRTELAEAIVRALTASDQNAAGEWRDGVPPKPWANEWFIAQTVYDDRVVLTSLPEEYSYDFKTADETYIKADKIKRWMQFPDSDYIAPAATPSPQRGDVEQGDRDAAAEAYWAIAKGYLSVIGSALKAGANDDSALVQLFARHRLAALTPGPAVGELERLRAENERLSKAVASGVLGTLLEDEETTTLVDFLRYLREQKSPPTPEPRP